MNTNSRLQTLLALITCILVLAVAAINRDGKIWGHDIHPTIAADSAQVASQVDSVTTLVDGTMVIIVALLVVLLVFVPRPYCRFVCPTGTLFKFVCETNNKTNK